MKREEIMEMVKQSDLEFLLGDHWLMHDEFVAFAKLVAAKEREACAKVCDDIHANYEAEDVFSSYAEAIRARGEQT